MGFFIKKTRKDDLGSWEKNKEVQSISHLKDMVSL
jgi:hypothetical protein